MAPRSSRTPFESSFAPIEPSLICLPVMSALAAATAPRYGQVSWVRLTSPIETLWAPFGRSVIQMR